ncbi:MAG TPA: ABC transporter ATP-binding protein [Anaerolineales bacterium]|nr:ABC transporter ATP-binding protein [Anaerolineales bacterium]
MSAIIEIQDVGKKFGNHQAVAQLDLSIEQGELFGLVGPNGAGKTTTLRMLVTLLRPDRGEIRINGLSVLREARQVRKLIGYIPDVFGLYGNLTVAEYLDFFGACYGIVPDRRRRLIGELLELVSIAHRREDLVDTLSRGLQQRLALARVLMHDPQVLVLDEPASGLDPRARVEIRRLLAQIAERGKTIVISSHVLTDIAELCSRVAIMEQGNLVECGTLEQLSQHVTPLRRVRIAVMAGADVPEIKKVLTSIQGVSNVKMEESAADRARLTFELEFQGDDSELHQMLGALLERGLPVIHFGEVSRNLEDVFLHSTRGIVS